MIVFFCSSNNVCIFLQDPARLTYHVTAFLRTRVIRVIMHGLLLALLIQLRSISNFSQAPALYMKRLPQAA
jgi:hypothetical protein